MANGSAQPESAIATYRVLRELGPRSQRSYAALRSDGSVLVLHRFARTSKPDAALVTAEEMAILLRDARCLAKNWHPNIARVRHVDLSIDGLDIATELIDGVTLEELLGLARARRVHPEEPVVSHAVIARILLDVLGGLSALHSLRDGINAPLGVFHGELCPANVVVGKDGVARIVSVFRPRPVTITARSEGLGYASPETIASSSAADVAEQQDARADIYAVGVMLWEALTERRLYDDPTPARIAQRQREEEIPPPNARLAEVTMRALAFDRALRFRTAQDMAANIRAVAGTVAQGSLVAQLVNELAGEHIRARRAELDPLGRRSLPPPARSGSYSLAAPPTAEASRDPMSAVTPSAPPVLPASSRTSESAPSASGPVRIAVPSAPDVETSYAPRPPTPRHALTPPAPPGVPRVRPPQRPPFPAHALPFESSTPPSSAPPPSGDDDELPGPRESTPDDAYLEQLAAAIRAAKPARVDSPLDVADLVEDGDVDDGALTVAREVEVSPRSMAPAPPAISSPSSLSPSSPAAAASTPSFSFATLPLPSFPEAEQPTTPRALPVTPHHQPSTRTPFVVDVVPELVAVATAEPPPSARKRTLIIGGLVMLLLLGVAGAAFLTRSSTETTPTNASSDRGDPPSAVIVAPPPAVDPLPHAASAPPALPETSARHGASAGGTPSKK